jgi:hypothetical protein
MAAIYIDKGTDFSIEFTLSKDDGSPFDLTDCTVISKIRKYPTSTKYNSFAITIVNAPTGKLRMELDKLNTTSLTEGINYYDVFVTDLSGRTFKVIEGEAIVYETSSTVEGEPILTTNFGSISVDTSNVQDGYVLMYDEDIELYRFVDPDVVLERSVRDGYLPPDFLQQLDVDLDDRIDVDSGSF